MERIFIGDVHGCIKTLKALIEKINPSKEDKVRFIGDLIDRGPGSKQVLDFIISKQLQGYFWESVLGNHEAMLLEWEHTPDSPKRWDTFNWWMSNGGNRTIESFGGIIGDDYISWLKNLPQYIIEEDIILVHAGLDFVWGDPIKRMVDDVALNMEKSNPYEYSNRSHLWIRDYHVRPDVMMGKILITGHTTHVIGDIMHHHEYHIKLDNGCFKDLPEFNSYPGTGMLVAYNLDKGEFITQICIDGE